MKLKINYLAKIPEETYGFFELLTIVGILSLPMWFFVYVVNEKFFILFYYIFSLMLISGYMLTLLSHEGTELIRKTKEVKKEIDNYDRKNEI